MEKISVQITCPSCQSGVEFYPAAEKTHVDCSICRHVIPLEMHNSFQYGAKIELQSCPCCQRKDFYRQKDFNRKIGVILFVIAAILSIWTYGMSLVALYLLDLFLFSRLGEIVICYNCQTIFRKLPNAKSFDLFNHEMNDRIVYSGHNFHGQGIKH
ncbi:MAG: hypothetical protein QE271_05075 [Bacteriovoracaceae bacterium]|nr:hypothetical protein [Bacteriovoracaceae bacterium]